jgi:histidinol phosphatase-like PHP family hydrolase
VTLTNGEISELLALTAGGHEGNKQRAARRAAHSALTWPVEVGELVDGHGDVRSLRSVGPWIATLIEAWLADPPEPPPPGELRAGFRSYAWARDVLRQEPSWREAVRGDLQMHTTFSDGSLSVAAMARAGVDRGYEYISITDHSKGLAIAGGMDESVLARQAEDIANVNLALEAAGSDLRVLRSLEMNLGTAGEGDMERDAVRRLDVVIGSFHSQLRSKDDQTERYLAGLRNPDIQILGHPRCRMWNRRTGMKADWKRVFEEAASLDKAIEVDAHPNRQDIDIDLLGLARESGVRISIGTDAHNSEEMRFMDIGLAAVAEAHIPRERILNYMPAGKLLEWSASLREG